MIKEEKLMQVIRMTIEGVVYEMYAPVILQPKEEMRKIEQIEFGELIETKYLVGFLLQYINSTRSKNNEVLH